MDNWKNRPALIANCPPEATHVLYIDENGSASMKNIIKSIDKGIEIDENERYLGVGSVLIDVKNHEEIKTNIIDLKNKYWENGLYTYNEKGNTVKKRVVFHSNEIIRGKKAFNNGAINGEIKDFYHDLDDFMTKINCTINYAFIDKKSLYSNYGNPVRDPYGLAFEFILERVIKFCIKPSDKLIIILESRGKEEDFEVHNYIMSLLRFGNNYVSKKELNRVIGVYFNPKWNSNNLAQSFFGLEIADLYSYPIFKYCRYGTIDASLNLYKNKIQGYPDFNGKGIKKFP